MSTDIIKCQKKYIFFKGLKSKQREGAREGVGWGSLDSFECGVKNIVSFCVHPNLCQLSFPRALTVATKPF